MRYLCLILCLFCVFPLHAQEVTKKDNFVELTKIDAKDKEMINTKLSDYHPKK